MVIVSALEGTKELDPSPRRLETALLALLETSVEAASSSASSSSFEEEERVVADDDEEEEEEASAEVEEDAGKA